MYIGPDLSFCSGDYRTLQANNGFVKYLWNNGNTGNQLQIAKAGQYSVTGTTAEGCRASDTMMVLKVFDKPGLVFLLTPTCAPAPHQNCIPAPLHLTCGRMEVQQPLMKPALLENTG
jgi:hypothetical protein